MIGVNVRFNMKELELLSTLAADQLFRKEFIDSRVAGCHMNPEELKQGKELIARIRTMTDRAKGITSPRRVVAGA